MRSSWSRIARAARKKGDRIRWSASAASVEYPRRPSAEPRRDGGTFPGAAGRAEQSGFPAPSFSRPCPSLILLIVSLAAGASVALVTWRYPRDVAVCPEHRRSPRQRRWARRLAATQALVAARAKARSGVGDRSGAVAGSLLRRRRRSGARAARLPRANERSTERDRQERGEVGRPPCLRRFPRTR